MNFIAGFLMMVFKNEETTFNALRSLVSEFRMADLFNTELPKLKVFFFQLDRMVSIVDSDLHGHFKEEGINASYFASAWFITLFTNSLKQNQDSNFVINESLMQLWDYFLVSGWKAIAKLGLFVLKTGSNDLRGMAFEEILNEISEYPKRILTAQRESTLYLTLAAGYSGQMISYHLDRL